MSKQKKKQNSPKSGNNKQIVPQKYQSPILLLILVLLLVIFFNKAIFEGKVFSAPDAISPMSFKTYLEEARKENVFPLWIPYVFSGMPSFASLMVQGTRWYDMTNYLWGQIVHVVSYIFINPEIAWYIVYYFLFGAGIFLLLRKLGLDRFPSLFAGTATVFMMYVIIWAMVAHGTKILTITFLPYIFLLMIEIKDKFSWMTLAGLILAIHLMFEGSHVQMIFYTLFAIGAYFVYLLAYLLVKKEKLVPYLRMIFATTIAGVIAFSMSSDRYLSILEYNKYSIRGSQPLIKSESAKSAGEAGLDYQYATNWSFSPEEMITFLIPSYYGFGDYEYQGPLSNNQSVRVNTYFGQMPFTDAPEYMGVITIILAVIGFVKYRKEPFVQFSLFMVIVSLLISFGRTFPVLFDLMFYHFPYFNRFRAPSMILILTQIFLPILSAYGLQAVFEAGKGSSIKFAKKSLYWIGAFVILLLLAYLFRGSLQDSYFALIENSRKIPQQIYSLLFDNMMGDLTVALLISAATCLVIYLFLTRKLSYTFSAISFLAILLFDMWRVDFKPMFYSDKQEIASIFAKPDYVSYIQRDTTLYRVIQLQDQQPVTSNTLAYFLLQNAYGYTGAKLRNYQNMIEIAGITNPNVMRLLGVKYIISDKPENSFGTLSFSGTQFVYKNDNILPRAFLVKNYKIASALETLEDLRDGKFDPAQTAYFETNPMVQIDEPDSSASVRVVDYKLQEMKVNIHASGNNFLVLSEVYYPKGWHAFIDGKPAKIYPVDYFLRGISVPRGNHIVTLKFEPRTYYIGRSISMTANVLLIVWFVVASTLHLMKRKKKITG